MVSRQETARPLLTAGEVMQLPPTDELVLVSGCHPIRARKARYYEDQRLKARVCEPPSPTNGSQDAVGKRSIGRADDWSDLPLRTLDVPAGVIGSSEEDSENGGIRREPMLPDHEAVVKEEPEPTSEFVFADDEPDDEAVRAKALSQRFGTVARQAAPDSDDGIPL
jgi:type IV secretion system protein VirD4